MGYIGEWIRYGGIFLGLLAVIFIPSYAALRFLRMPRLSSIALAPSWTFAIVGIATIVFHDVGIGWNLASFVLVSSLVVLICALAWHHLPSSMSKDRQPYENSKKYQRSVVGAAALVMVILVVPMMMRMDPNVPSWGPDPMFHYNGVNNILTTENASMFGAMDTNHGVRVTNTDYPSVWHGIVSLVASVGNIVPAAHMLTFVITPIIWVLGMTYLGIAALPHHRLAALFVPIMLLVFPVFPAYLAVTKGFWPNSLALAATPAVIGAAIASYHRYRWSVNGQSVHLIAAYTAVVGVGTVGVTATHPSIIFSLVWVSIPTIIVAIARFVNSKLAHLPRKQRIGAGILTGVALSLPPLVLLAIPRVRVYLSREFQWGWEDIPERLVFSFVAWPVGKNPIVLAIVFAVVIGALAIALAKVFRHRHLHWIGYAWGIQTLLILGGYFPLGPLTAVAGLWYHDMYRLFSVQAIFLALLYSLAAAEVLNWFARKIFDRDEKETDVRQLGLLRRHPVFIAFVSTVLVVGLSSVSFVFKARTAYADAKPRFGEEHILNSREELELIENLDELIPPGSVVLGDPTTGIVYAPAYSRVNSVFSQVNQRGMDVDGNVLANNFRSIEYDPRVCTILNKYGIGYYYEDTPITYQNIDRSKHMPGLYDVDTSNGYFDLVAEVDGARVWKISGCPGEMRESAWWHLRPRRLPLLQPPLLPPSGMPQPVVANGGE